jgi:hypothetical protein
MRLLHGGPARGNPGKSAASNLQQLLPGVDGRSIWVRRCRDLIGEHVADLGGPEGTSAAEKAIIRRACVLITELEIMERKFALNDGATADQLDIYARVAGNMRRLLEAVGLQRRSRNVTPSLAAYLASDGMQSSGNAIIDADGDLDIETADPGDDPSPNGAK